MPTSTVLKEKRETKAQKDKRELGYIKKRKEVTKAYIRGGCLVVKLIPEFIMTVGGKKARITFDEMTFRIDIDSDKPVFCHDPFIIRVEPSYIGLSGWHHAWDWSGDITRGASYWPKDIGVKELNKKHRRMYCVGYTGDAKRLTKHKENRDLYSLYTYFLRAMFQSAYYYQDDGYSITEHTVKHHFFPGGKVEYI